MLARHQSWLLVVAKKVLYLVVLIFYSGRVCIVLDRVYMCVCVVLLFSQSVIRLCFHNTCRWRYLFLFIFSKICKIEWLLSVCWKSQKLHLPCLIWQEIPLLLLLSAKPQNFFIISWGDFCVKDILYHTIVVFRWTRSKMWETWLPFSKS